MQLLNWIHSANRKMTIQIGDYVKALYSFPGEAASDLSLDIGDIVRITDVVDGNWAAGSKAGHHNKSGTFPLAFVERLTLPSILTGQKVFLAVEDFLSEQNGDLEFSKGEIIVGLEPVNESWWRGKSGPLKGIFPLTMVAELEFSDGLRSRSASACSSGLKLRSDNVLSQSESTCVGSTTKVTSITFARALVDVRPQLDGELAFQLGDLIEITDIIDDDWFYGKCHNKEGLVSSVCVEIFMSESSSTDSSSKDLNNLGFQKCISNQVLTKQESRESSDYHHDESVGSQTGTCVKGSYTSENTRSHDEEVTPYGRAVYPFVAQIPTELSLEENSIVTLIQHVDSEWTEGEVNGKQGLFPTSFIEIIVDCPYTYKQGKNSFLEDSSGLIENAQNAAVKTSYINGAPALSDTKNVSESCYVNNDGNTLSVGSINTELMAHVCEENHEIGLILFNFAAEVSEDISVAEGDTVEVIGSLDENWLKIKTEEGKAGQVPKNYVEIIGPWPKAKSDLTEKNSFSNPTNAFTQNSQEQSKSVDTKDNINLQHSVPSTSDNFFTKQNSSDDADIMKEFPSATHKPVLPSRGKPPLLPKPALPLKPTIAPKPSSVITQQSFIPTRLSLTTDSKTNLVMLEKRTNSLSSLDNIITEEISKAKGNSLSKKSAGSSEAVSDISLKDNEHNFTNSSPVVHRKTSHDNPCSDSMYTQNFHNITGTPSLCSTSTNVTHLSGLNPTSLNSEHKRTNTKRSILTSSVSCSDENTTVPDAINRRKSDTFALLMTRNPPGITEEDSSFVNKAFQMDTAEGKLIDFSDKNSSQVRRVPARVAPPRPASAIDSLSSYHADNQTGKLKAVRAAPPRPTGPRMASAPSKTPLMPTRVEPSVALVPRRSAPKAPGIHNQNNNSTPLSHSTSSRHRRHPPRPSSIRSAPKRPPPRPADLMSFSPEESGGVEDDTKGLIADLKSKLEENQADIKKFEQMQAELKHNLTITNSQDREKEAEARDNLEFVERQILGLQEEEVRLKENLFALSPHEATLEKARLLAAQHAQEELKRKEEEKKREAEMKEKRKDQRAKVIGEILETEKDFLLSLQLCLETFLDRQKPPAGVDLNFLLGNMEEITDVSQKMVVHLESCTSGKSFEEQLVGKCFTRFSEDMKNTYAPYCRNHDDVITAMERYTENTEVNDYLNAKIEKMREQMNVFDMAGVLIKPVQRILKYPLLLNELLKNTDEDHSDREDVVAAINAMTDVARAINEYKRRKDLVYKYKKLTDQTLSNKISKLSFHSIRKKSSRIKGRLSTNFGIGLQMRDEKFEKEEAKFRHLERAVKTFLRSVFQFLDQSQETMQYQENVIYGIKEFYSVKECEEATKLHEVIVKILDLFDNTKETIENTVIASLNTLVGLFSGPAKIIEKRYDKLLDYNYQLGKVDNDKELQAAKNDYEALNAQLLDELPKFYKLAYLILEQCISVYVHTRRDFMNQALKEECALLVFPFMASRASLMETFKARHMTVFDHLSLLSFIPKGFNPRVDTIKADRVKQKSRVSIDSGTQQTNLTPGTQTDAQKAYLEEQYASKNKLFTVATTFLAVDPTDISLTQGSLVGVIKELDPMGNKDKWYIDDGANKGFAPCSILAPIGSLPSDNESKVVEEDLISILSGDSGDLMIISGNDEREDCHISESLLDPKEQEQNNSQCYYALYNFVSRNPNETSLIAGRPVTVLSFHDSDGNSEWWLVESEGNCGYAPANYMAPMICN